MAVTYTPEFEDAVREWVESLIPAERLPHVQGVVVAAERLARRFAPEEQARARLAGWLHDIARGWSPAELFAYAEAHDLPITPDEAMTPMLLHGAVAYHLAQDQFGLDDPTLAEACALHTTGGPGMSTLAKIVFLADLIEPTRTYKKVGHLRSEARHDLDGAVLRAIDHTIKYLLRRQRLIDPRMLLLRNELLAAGATYTRKSNSD